MKTPIAIFNLLHQGAKTAVSVGGVAFALLLVFMQLGFKGAVSYTATNVLERLDFDVLILPTGYLHLYEASSFDRQWLSVAENTEGVAEVVPLWVMIQNWRKLPSQAEVAAGDFESQFLPIAVIAFSPNDQIFLPGQLPELKQDPGILFDRNKLLLDDSTKSDYGPWNGTHFTEEDVALSSDPNQPERKPTLRELEYEIAGLFKLGTGLAANAAAIMGQSAFQRIAPWNLEDTTVLGLIRMESSDPADHLAVVQALRKRVGTGPGQQVPAVTVLSREQALQAEREYWLWQQPIGLIFQMGVVISLLVGAAIVYMVLSTDVANRLPEYATLLAMGYSRRYLVGIVMTQAIVLSMLGFVSAWGCAELLYRVTTTVSGIPLTMDPWKIIQVATLGFAMCCVSGLLALRKLWKAEPATLF